MATNPTTASELAARKTALPPITSDPQIYHEYEPGQWTQYWDNGRKKAESKWRNFHADGPAKLWDRQGQLLSQVNFANGVKQ